MAQPFRKPEAGSLKQMRGALAANVLLSCKEPQACESRHEHVNSALWWIRCSAASAGS